MTDPERKRDRGWRWVEATGAAAGVLGVMLIVQSINAANIQDKINDLTIRQATVEAIQRSVVSDNARFDAVQQEVLRRLNSIDSKLDSLRDRFP